MGGQAATVSSAAGGGTIDLSSCPDYKIAICHWLAAGYFPDYKKKKKKRKKIQTTYSFVRLLQIVAMNADEANHVVSHSAVRHSPSHVLLHTLAILHPHLGERPPAACSQELVAIHLQVIPTTLGLVWSGLPHKSF